MKKRIDWLDVLKGISIILVIIGHLNTTTFTHNLIYNVHLFAFVFVSGVFYKNRVTFAEFIKKDLIKIWVLFLFFSIIWIGFNYLYTYALYALRGREVLSNLGKYVLNALITLVFGSANLTGVSLGATWYLAMLFALKTVYYILDRCVKQNIIWLTLICIIVSLIGVFVLNGYKSSPYYMFSAMSAMLIFHIGRLLKEKVRTFDSIDSRKFFWIMTACGGGYTALSAFSGSVNLGANTFENPWVVFPNMVLGILFLVCLSILISKMKRIKKILAYCGKNSLSIMGWHSEIRICMLFFLSLVGMNNTLLRNIIVLFVTLVLCVPLNLFLDRLITVINQSDKRTKINAKGEI